jgi:hypothetical protein
MHVYCKFMIMLRFYLFHHHVLQYCLNKDRSFIMLMSYIRLFPIYMLIQFLNDVLIVDR